MNPRYRLSKAAATDLMDIWSYLAEHASFDVADRVIADLHAGMNELSELPSQGHTRIDLTDDPVKFYRVHRYLIVFVPSRRPIGIVRILHSARDVRSLLDESP